tara:strand:+ start:1338 stop:2030 length:693 start_codon:yes stop_codon:yes gene_type:complete
LKILLRNIYIVLIVAITIVFFSHKIIIKKTIEIFLSNIIEKKFLVERISIDISKSTIELHNIKIKNDKNFNYKNLLECKEIFINYNLNSIFSETLIINELILKNLNFYVEINDDLKANEEIKNLNLNDNLDVIKKTKDNYKQKIYPKKKKDKNFIINNVQLINPRANIKFLNIYEYSNFKLSEMVFSKVGNSKINSQHFKEVLKIFLIDMYLRIPNFEIRNKIKKIYKLK